MAIKKARQEASVVGYEQSDEFLSVKGSLCSQDPSATRVDITLHEAEKSYSNWRKTNSVLPNQNTADRNNGVNIS